jgi:hypothetical protein
VSSRTIGRLVAAALPVAFAVGVAPAAFAGQHNTECSASYDGDKMAAHAWTGKEYGHTVGGESAGIDSWATCDASVPWDADNIIDIYKNGRVYKYESGSWTICIDPAGVWRGYGGSENYGWSRDLDTQGTCNWGNRSIKVEHLAKGQWGDGTIKSVTSLLTDSPW